MSRKIPLTDYKDWFNRRMEDIFAYLNWVMENSTQLLAKEPDIDELNQRAHSLIRQCSIVNRRIALILPPDEDESQIDKEYVEDVDLMITSTFQEITEIIGEFKDLTQKYSNITDPPNIVTGVSDSDSDDEEDNYGEDSYG